MFAWKLSTWFLFNRIKYGSFSTRYLTALRKKLKIDIRYLEISVHFPLSVFFSLLILVTDLQRPLSFQYTNVL